MLFIRNKNNKRLSSKLFMKLDAYMTVEASFIVPCAAFIIALIIYLAFYMYGRCMLSQDTYIVGYRAVTFYERQGFSSASEYVVERADAQFGNKYFSSIKPQIQPSQKGDELTLISKSALLHNGISGYFKKLKGNFEYEQGASTLKVNPAGKLRKLKRIGDVAKKAVQKQTSVGN